VIPGKLTKTAEAIRSRDRDWYAPESFRFEWLNVCTFYIRQKILHRDMAIRAYNRGMALVEEMATPDDPARIINLYLASGCSSYDCRFIALAEDLKIKLVTFDQELFGAFPETAVGSESF
jgi:hypothetical protein